VPVIAIETLSSYAQKLFLAAGVSEADATCMANSLVEANLRGHDSHGVMRVASYIEQIEQGRIFPTSQLDIINESASSIVADGNWGLGLVLAHRLVDKMIAKAASSAVVIGTLRRSSHIGRLGEYAEKFAAQGLISMALANTHGAAQRVAPVGGKRPRLGTNPICIGVPGGSQGPFIFDIGTSATAEGKVRVKKIAGEPVPPGWILDPEGNPSTNPNDLYGNPPGTILPLGGDQAYKGFGLAFMIEMLCGGMSGGQCAYPNPPAPIGNCGWFMAISPEFFAGTDHLLQEVQQLEHYVRSVPKIDESKEIYLPGDPERSTLNNRRAKGIPLDEGNWNALVALGNRLGVAAPALAS
jgi:uncharacterized oxidoreductase